MDANLVRANYLYFCFFSHVFQFLVLNNCGTVCGGNCEAIYGDLHCYGSIQDILLIPAQPFAVVVFEDTSSSAAAADYLSGNVPSFSKDPVFPAFIERAPSVGTNTCSNLFDDTNVPQGLKLLKDAISEHEETVLAQLITWGDCEESKALRQREVRHFGYAFDYSLQGVQKDAPLSEGIPDECVPFLDRLVAAGHLDRLPDQLTVTRYLPGQAKMRRASLISLVSLPPLRANRVEYRPTSTATNPLMTDIVLLSLGSPIVMNFRHSDGRQAAQVLPPRSALILSGDSRYVWTHGKRLALRLSSFWVYENIAEQFSDTRYKQWPRVAEFLDSLEQGSLLLDAGCGNGKYLTHHSKLVKLGFDRSQGLCNICRQRGLEVLQADTLQIPFRNGVFEACISIAVIHHLSTVERRQAAVHEILRVLRRGGRALVYVWALEQNNPSGDEKNSPSKYLNPNKAAAVDCGEPVEAPESASLPVHCNRTQFQARDMLVPWHSKSTQETHYRYYHLFQQGELRELLESVAPGCVQTEYHDQGNWCAVIVKRGSPADEASNAS
ncbi:hypothetical protein HPB51_009883 [Rhipicephalus microplus]|uniref:Methyltransferase type 11 domain-containing protein n=1 Tax=Rhipicephalus microplus TaxID=6941 RepID=A0A9J6ETF0_RHIMP|nr:hypothetical protein HPB51_009883 [Rhipicephalus microplus]